jgi:hypothetical protein
MNGAAGVTSFQWERDGDVAGVASFLLEQGKERMAGSMSGLLGDAVGRGGEGRRFGRLADRFLVELVPMSLPVKVVLRPWSESSTAAPTDLAFQIRRWWRYSVSLFLLRASFWSWFLVSETSGLGGFVEVLRCGLPLIRFSPGFPPKN